MPISLNSTATPLGLRSTYATDEENAAAVEAMQQDVVQANTSLGRGLSRGLYQTPAMLANATGQVIEPLSAGTAQPMFDWASQQNTAAQKLYAPTDPRSFSDVHNLSDAGSYVAGAVGENLPQIPFTLAGGVAARLGLRGMAMAPMAKNFVGATAASYPMVMGENVGELRADPTAMANTTPLQRLGNTAGAAALQAPLDAVGDALLMGRAAGGGKILSNVFKDGVGKTAKDAALHVAKAVPEAAVTEGLPEAGQEFIKQGMMTNVNPERDKSKDEHNLANSFFAGWAAGGPTSAVGRGADVAWAQGRGATEAIRNLISPKALPANLMNSDDQSINQWDKQDDAQRNETAKGLADRILDSDAAQSMKDAAKSFYDKAASGASDAWSSISQALSDNETYQSVRDSADRFGRSVNAANKAAFGEKHNAESTNPEADKSVRDVFDTHVDRNIYNAKFDGGTDVADKLFSDMKKMLAPGHDLDATELVELSQHFGGMDGAEKAVNAMREEMVRHAMVEHDDKFAEMFKKTHETKLQEMQALTDIVKRYSPYGGKLSDREATKYAKMIYDGVRSDDSDVGAKKGEKGYEKRLAAKQQFIADTKSFFGGNYEKAIEAFRPKADLDAQKFETETHEGNITGDEVSQPKPRFVGSATKSASQAAASNPGMKETIEDHGGFWRLDKESAKPADMEALKAKITGVQDKIVAAKAKGRTTKTHAAHLSKLNKQLAGMRTEEHVKEDRARMAAVSRGLRQGKGAEAHYVKHLTPLEYSEAAGIDKEVVAKHLGVTVEELENHPARMIQAGQRQLEKDKLSLDKDDLDHLAKSTEQALKDLPADVLLKGSQLARVRGALNKGGREARELLAEENLEHGVSMRGDRLVNNWYHGGNGVFTVHMKDGKQFTMSAQVLIKAMRKRAEGDMGDASAIAAFSTGVAALQGMEGFDKITVNDLWGKEQKPSKNQIGDGENKKTKANEQFGVFGPYFRLEPGMTLSSARSSEVRRKSTSETEEEAAIEEYEAIEEYMMAELNLRNLKHREERAIKDGNTALAKFTAQKIPEITQRMNELADQFPIVTDKEERSARIDELEEKYDELEQKRELYSGENSGSEEPGLKDVSAKDTITPLEHAGEPKRDYNDDGTRKHAPGKTLRLKKDERDLLRAKHQLEMAKVKLAKGLATQKDVTNAQNKVDRLMSQLEGSVGKSENRTARVTYNGQVLNLRPGVRAKDLIGEARKLIASVKALRGIIGNTGTADIVMNLMGQVAAANKAGDTTAREALLAMASDKMVETVVDEMLIAKELNDTARLKQLNDLGKEHIALSKKYKANQEAMDEYAKSYLPFLGKKSVGAQAKQFEAAPERWSHHSQFYATLENKTDDEILADGIARKARIERLESRDTGYENKKLNELITLMYDEQDAARAELRARKAGDKAKKIEVAPFVGRPDPVTVLPLSKKEAFDKLDREEAARKAVQKARRDARTKARNDATNELAAESEASQEELTAQTEANEAAKAEQHQQAFDKAMSDVEKLKLSLGDTGTALRAAYEALKQSYVDGKVSKDLVPQLRAALAAFRAVAGDAARVVVAVVQRFIKEYQEAAKNIDVKQLVQQVFSKTATAVDQAMSYGSDAYNKLFGTTPQEHDKQSKLIARRAAKFAAQFKTGFETNDRTDSLSSLGPYTTHMMKDTDRNRYVFSVVPHSLLEAMANEHAPDNKEQFIAEMRSLMGKKPKVAVGLSVFTVTYNYKTREVIQASSVVGSASEDFMREKGVLDTEKNERTGQTWNKLKGVSTGNLMDLLGEAYARLQKTTGKDHIDMNWVRHTGAAKDAKQERSAKFNAEGSQPTGTPVTKQDMADIKDYITKVLGPNVELRLSKALGGNSASWARKPNGEALIKIAVNAANPLSKAHHEAMHEFFQRLMDDGSPAAEVLRQAANNPLVVRQIEQFFHSNANYAAIKSQIANDEHERVAYMFQLWAAGKLKVGPKTESWFQKVVNFLREVSGVLSNDQKAEAIMAHFHDGKMSDSNAVAEVLANDPKLVKDLMTRGDEVMNPLAQKLKELMYTSQNMLTESGNKTFEKIGRMFSTETGQQGEAMSFFDAKTMKTNQMNDRLWKILKKSDGKDVALALEMLQQGGTSKDAKVEAIRKEIRKMLDEMHTYATAKGVEIKKVDNYFPRAWDSIAIAENKAEFIEMLRADHLKNGKGELDVAVAMGIANQLIDNRGAEPLHESELENGYSPFMAAANKRVLDFITSPEFSKFQEKSLEHILTNYVSQLVHKAEYTERFGSNGTKLRDMVQDGVGEAVGPEWAEAKTKAQDKLAALKERLKTASPEERTKAMIKDGYRYGEISIKHITDELTNQLARDKFQGFEPKLRNYVRSIMAMEGTLGADINPKLRKLSSSLIVYENMRLLGMSLFSQIIDPLGVLVRGGTVSDAFDTFKRGVGGTIAAWRGTPLEDSMSNLAMQLGIVDAGGFLNSQADAYASVFLGKTAKKWNDRLFRWNGVEGFSQGTRVGAMAAAINFIKAHSKLPTEHSERWLAELNLKAADIKLDANGELDYFDPKIQQAIFRWVETAILRPNASMRPAWASDPHWSLIFHMKQFTYAMQKVLLERVHNEVKHGNLDPAISMVLTYVPAMMAADFLRGLAANGGDEPPWKRNWKFSDYLTEGVQRAGLLGVPQFALDVQKWGPGELSGPAGEQVIRTAERFHKDVARDHALDMRAALSGLPKDVEKAQAFSGVEHAAKKTLRDAFPVNSLAKHYLFDEIVGT